MTLVNLYVELVVTGCHTLLWIGLVVLTFTGYQNVNWERLFALELALLFLAASYLLGIVVDKLADSLFTPLDRRLRQRVKLKDLPDLLTMRFHILHESKDLYEQLDYIRSRLRIARAAGPNFGLTTLAALAFVRFQLDGVLIPAYRGWVYAGIVLLGVLLAFASYWAWAALTKSYIASTVAAYRLLNTEAADPAQPAPKKDR